MLMKLQNILHYMNIVIIPTKFLSNISSYIIYSLLSKLSKLTVET